MFTTEILEKLDLFGPYLIFLLIFLEGLNLTGIPAIVIMPAIGFSIYTSSYSFFFIYLISILAAILACLAYYAVSYKFGGALYDFFYQKFPSTQKSLDKATELSHRFGPLMCLIGRVVPTVRTFISLMSGIFKIPLTKYAIYSTGGILIWNFVTLSIGYIVAIISN